MSTSECAVDQDGYVLDEIVQTRRDTKAAKRLLIRFLKKQGLSSSVLHTRKWAQPISAWETRRRLGFNDMILNPINLKATRFNSTWRCQSISLDQRNAENRRDHKNNHDQKQPFYDG